MLLLLHITIALASVVQTTYLFFFPSKDGLRMSYGLVVLTVASGTALVISRPASLTQACMSGLAYIAIVSLGIGAARHKLGAAAQS